MIRLWIAGLFVIAGVLPRAHAAALHFDWPLPSALSVTAKIDKRGNSSTAHYLVELRAEDGDHLTLSFRDFEFLSLNGVDARGPEVRAKLGPLAGLTATLPSMRISPGGDYLGTLGLEQMAERMLALLPQGDEPQVRERLESYFRSPQVQHMMQQKSGDVWNTWVGAWNGLELEAGQTLTRTVPVTVMARQLEQSVLFEHLGAANETCADCVRLRLTTVIEGPEVVALVSGIVRELGGAQGAEMRDAFVSARSLNVAEVVTEAHGLRPHHAVSRTEVTLRGADGKERSRKESKEYWFQWRQ
jgi:hypothetical protein